MSIHAVFEGDGIQNAIRDLFHQGYAYIPKYDDTRAQKVIVAYRHLIESCEPSTFVDLKFAFEHRPNHQPEIDDGFVRHGGGESTEYVFQWRKRGEDAISETLAERDDPAFELIDSFLADCRNMHGYHTMILCRMLSVCDALGVVALPFVRAFYATALTPTQTSRPMTRVAYYPSTVAFDPKLRFDRSFITLRVGLKNNKIFAKFRNGTIKDVSPKPGELLVHWGEKAYIETRGNGKILYPLAYSLWKEGTEEQHVLASYYHTCTELWDASPITY